MEKIGFFGGCFNPPTKAHIGLAKLVLKELGLDKIIFIPMNDYYEKMELISGSHRVKMLELLTKDESNIEVDDFEIKLNKKIYAIDAFEYIDKNYNCEKFFIMGSDNYIKMKNWKDAHKFENYQYIILDRLHNINLNENIKIVSNNQFSNISSSDARKLISEGKDASDYLTQDVYRYIKDNKLYIKEV